MDKLIPLKQRNYYFSVKPVQQPTSIPELLMLALLGRYDDKRELMVEMWLYKPQLEKQGGFNVTMLLSIDNLQQ
jgi:hypothetical protein